jgi:hypothetical protein
VKLREIANEGAPTIPSHEHGGHTHIENISQGSRVYLPVYVDRVKLSLGDIHFSRGDEQIASYMVLLKWLYIIFLFIFYLNSNCFRVFILIYMLILFLMECLVYP